MDKNESNDDQDPLTPKQRLIGMFILLIIITILQCNLPPIRGG